MLGIYCMQIMHMCTVRTLERSLNVRRALHIYYHTSPTHCGTVLDLYRAARASPLCGHSLFRDSQPMLQHPVVVMGALLIDVGNLLNHAVRTLERSLNVRRALHTIIHRRCTGRAELLYCAPAAHQSAPRPAATVSQAVDRIVLCCASAQRCHENGEYMYDGACGCHACGGCYFCTLYPPPVAPTLSGEQLGARSGARVRLLILAGLRLDDAYSRSCVARGQYGY